MIHQYHQFINIITDNRESEQAIRTIRTNKIKNKFKKNPKKLSGLYGRILSYLYQATLG